MRGWQYSELVLDQNFTRDQFRQEFGQRATFPQVLINGNKIGGCTESIAYLRENKCL
jgi:glutaredoxin 3